MIISRSIGTVTKKGQVTIPVGIRELLQVRPNDTLAFEVVGDTIVVRKSASLRLDEVFGAVTPRHRPENFPALRDTAMEEHVARSTSLKP